VLHKEVITETGFDENAAEERQNDRAEVFFLPFKIFFVEKKPCREVTQCDAPIVQGIFPSRTGELFEQGLKWDTGCACWLRLWPPFSIQY